jgi:hypothetical protein
MGNLKDFSGTSMTRWRVIFLCAFYIVLSIVFLFLAYYLWPNKTVDANGAVDWSSNTSVRLGGWDIEYEGRLILIVIIAGSLGACIHGTTSLVTFRGNRNLRASWFCWYLLRPFIGSMIALIAYLLLRGGILLIGSNSNSINNDLNPYGITGIAGLVGMFSKQATDKLRELFDTLFKTRQGHGDDERKDKLKEAIPVTDVMIPISKIEACVVKEGQTRKDISLEDLHGKLNKLVTRVPVLDAEGRLICLVHGSLIYKFIADRCCGHTPPVTPGSLTLEDFLADPALKELTVDSLAFVPVTALIEDAWSKMEETKDCQDVLVTKNGGKDESVLGWLTNVDIGKLM